MATKVPKPIHSVDFTTGEIQDEINARAQLRAEIMSRTRVFRHPMSRERLPLVIEGESMTHQAHADSCDVNNIVSQFARTGILPPSDKTPMFDDVSHLNKPLSELTTAAQSTATGYDALAVESQRQRETAAKAKVDKQAEPSSSPLPSPQSQSVNSDKPSASPTADK